MRCQLLLLKRLFVYLLPRCEYCGSCPYALCGNDALLFVAADFVNFYELAGTEGSWEGGIDSPFSHYQSSASIVATETFDSLAGRNAGSMCSKYARNETVDIEAEYVESPSTRAIKSALSAFKL